MKLQLDRLDKLPADIADIAASDIRRIFPNPTLIQLQGDQDPPLFLSILLHGNETTGFRVLQDLQVKLASNRPRRSLMVFIGNVHATEAGQRHLDDQPDFNRIWAHGDTAYHQLAKDVLSAAHERGLFASIDIHNNTGLNPIYGCINALRPEDLYLAESFALIGVYYLNPPTTQSIAFSHLCPSITLECGQIDDEAGLAAAIRLVDHVLSLEQFPRTAPATEGLQLFETVGRVIVDPTASVSFDTSINASLVFRDDLEELNFTFVTGGALWATTEWEQSPIRVVDEHGADLTGEFFQRRRDGIFLKQAVIPAMITRDSDIITQDCLCYFMKPLDWWAT